MKIEVIGLGYIGLPTAVMFANHDQMVVGVDVKQDVVQKLNRGMLHIEEPGLEEALQEAVNSGNFKARTIPEKADVFILSVPTPNLNNASKSCDLSLVIEALGSILPLLETGNTVIVESTIEPKATENEIAPLIEQAGFTIGEDVFLVHCPERVLPGQILHELKHNNRIIGGVTEACTQKGIEVYQTFVEGHLMGTKAATAEMAKLMENTYRDVNIALSNELVKICDTLDIQAMDVIEMANQHPRVHLLDPGPGVGGHCLAVDPYFIAAKAPERSPLIQTARKVNQSMPAFIVSKVRELLSGKLGCKITICGITYKGNVDDIRESPALIILKQLQDFYQVAVHDPHVHQFDWIEQDLAEAVRDSELLLVLTDHSEYESFDSGDLVGMTEQVILDTKGVVQKVPEDAECLNLGDLSKFGKLNAQQIFKKKNREEQWKKLSVYPN
ncbi:capsular polysaccharide synthesis enzyme cap5O [Listeria floridensis FSL S10-1187]|uniref:Capsular polysaccharide synthesis enzyme cap5O n=1 Tax=Listeria floridensis FSL S10-1187 TaxID=1265817 RepID=A0ABN0RBW3_9LIST|nr:nucleotide sugar dehydrogenase [Listeria floridensis]EUJ26126.1 capsular polysaccharide synthesis enzyme cap5O [Listeria floridensis FSL S10-1187]